MAASNQIYRFHYQFSTGETQGCGIFHQLRWGILPSKTKRMGPIMRKDPPTRMASAFGFKWERRFQWERIHWRMYIGCFQKIGGNPIMDGYNGKTRLKWMSLGYHYFWKHPYGCFLKYRCQESLFCMEGRYASEVWFGVWCAWCLREYDSWVWFEAMQRACDHKFWKKLFLETLIYGLNEPTNYWDDGFKWQSWISLRWCKRIGLQASTLDHEHTSTWILYLGNLQYVLNLN